MGAAGELPEVSSGALVLSVLLALCRVGPLLLGVPFVGWLGRLLLLACGGGLLAPLLLPLAMAGLSSFSPHLPAPIVKATLWPWALLLLHELCVGLLLFLGAAVPWALLRGAGQLLEVGAWQPPYARRNDDTVAELCGLLSLCLFFGLGGGAMAVSTLAKSYSLIPLPWLSPVLQKPQVALLLKLFGQLFTLSLALALPVLCARLLAGLGLSLMLRGFLSARWQRRWPFVPLPALHALLELLTLFLGIAALVTAWHAHFRALFF
jgi:flagellar biosynthesis protein FliR